VADTERTVGPGLRASVVTGLRWSVIDVVAQQVIRFALTVALTRLIAPEDFGLLAMALVFTQLATMIGDLGLGPALVQRRVVERAHVATAFTVTTLAGLILAIAFYFLTFPIAAFYDEPGLRPVLGALAATYLLRGVAGIPRDLLRREMAFRSLAFIAIASVTLSAVAGLSLAVGGAGIWALVAQILVEGVLTTILVVGVAWRSGAWRPGLAIDRSALGDIAGFGLFVSGTRMFHYASTNVDNLIVGKVLGATSLGFYNLAYRLMLFPVLKVADVVATVSMPAFSSIQDDSSRLTAAFQRAVTYVAMFCFPVSVGVAVTAPVLVPAVFGNQWTAAVVTVQILAINGVRLAFGRLNGVVYEATGRPKWDFTMVVLTLVAYVVAFAIGVDYGVEGVAWAYTIAGYALVPLDQLLVSRALNVSPVTTLRRIGPVLLATALMAIVSAFLMAVIPESIAELFKATIVVGAAGVVYSTALLLIAPNLVRALRSDITLR